MKIIKFYYISNIHSVNDIQENGIKSDDDGNIPVFTIDRGKIKDVLNIAGYIAGNQLFLDEYALFEILHGGLSGEVIEDKVPGKTARYQRIVKQDFIDKGCLKFVNSYRTYFAI